MIVTTSRKLRKEVCLSIRVQFCGLNTVVGCLVRLTILCDSGGIAELSKASYRRVISDVFTNETMHYSFAEKYNQAMQISSLPETNSKNVEISLRLSYL